MKKSDLRKADEYVSAVDLNEECLCFGWSDSRPGRVDERRTALLCTPRRPGSGWSAVNKQRLDRLLRHGQVTPAGLGAIEQAKADGAWSRLDQVDALAVQDDLAAALDTRPPAREHFAAFPSSARRGILEWVAAAKTQQTRERRIEETARLAQQNLRANQWPRR